MKPESTQYFAGLAADSSGTDDDRRPLVLLHGLTFDRSGWRPALTQLRRITPGRRVLNLDLPGHGESPTQPSYRLEAVAKQVHAAVEAAELDSPVVVGHSAGAIIATFYAADFPVGGVINVDQPLQTRPFAELLQSLGAQLRGPDYRKVWDLFTAGFHLELLPPAARELVHLTSNPAQELLLGYWSDLLDCPANEAGELLEQQLANLRAGGRPYQVIAGDPVDPGYAGWLADVLPQATVTVIRHGGHFPHLANTGRFAAFLAATANWPG